MKRSRNLVFYLTVVSLLSYSFASVYGSESLPWGVERIHADCLWDNYPRDRAIDNPSSNAGQNVRVAIIDTGIDYYDDGWGNRYYPEDLADNVRGGRGFRYWAGQVQETTDYQDLDGHGTHVAGTIAAVDNEIGVLGTAPRAQIYAAKFFRIGLTIKSWKCPLPLIGQSIQA